MAEIIGFIQQNGVGPRHLKWMLWDVPASAISSQWDSEMSWDSETNTLGRGWYEM